MKTSKAGINLIKQFEGCRLKAYRCQAGVYTIGYGHTKGVTPGMTITQQQAEDMLQQDLATYEKAVDSTGAKLTQGQFDAAVSLCYNIGTSAFTNSTVASLIKADPQPRPELETAWQSWRIAAGKISNGLVARRTKEYAFYKKHSITLNKVIGVCAAITLVAGSSCLIFMS